MFEVSPMFVRQLAISEMASVATFGRPSTKSAQEKQITITIFVNHRLKRYE